LHRHQVTLPFTLLRAISIRKTRSRRHVMSSPILVTGSAGFIGFHLCQRLLADGFNVIGLDAMTDYYDVSLKEKRAGLLKAHKGYTPVIASLEAPKVLENLLAMHKPRMVVHLAAQAGVRYSIDAPRSYVESNINGTFELLEAARHHTPEHLLIASTSSVYGGQHRDALPRSA